jgi:type VII secretion integral membrane protein EccD
VESGYCRVTVAGPERWADLVLPGTVPAASLLPQVVRVCAPEHHGLEPGGWTLTTPDGTPVGPEVSLAHAGVVDGDVLTLRPERAPHRPSFVDDVRGAVEDRVDESAHLWKSSTTLGFGLVLAALGPLVLTVVMLAFRRTPVDLLVAVPGLLTALAAMALAARRAMPAVVHATLAAACGWGALTAGLLVVQARGPAPPAPVVPAVFALTGALAAAAVGWWIHESALPYLAALGVLTLATGGLVTVGLFVDGALGARVPAVVLVLGIGVLPRLALSMGGLSGLDYEVRHVGQADTERFEASLTTSDRLLLGTVLGAASGILAAVAVLAFTGSGAPDLLLAVLVCLLLLMRSRLFDRTRHVLVLRVAAVAGLGTTAVAAVQSSTWLGVVLPGLALLAGIAVAAVSAVELTDVPRASVRRLLNGLEVGIVIALCVTVVWATGVYGLVTQVSIGG